MADREEGETEWIQCRGTPNGMQEVHRYYRGRYPQSKIEEMRERKRKYDLERYTRMLREETEEMREERLEREREKRRNWSEDVRERKLQHLRVKSKERTRNETEEMREKRLKRMRERARERRRNETEEMREKRREYDRQRYRLKIGIEEVEEKGPKRNGAKSVASAQKTERLKASNRGKSRKLQESNSRSSPDHTPNVPSHTSNMDTLGQREGRSRTSRVCKKRISSSDEESSESRSASPSFLSPAPEGAGRREKKDVGRREKKDVGRREKKDVGRREKRSWTSGERAYKRRKNSGKGLKVQSEPDHTPNHEGTLDTSSTDTLEQRERRSRTSRVCKKRMSEEEIESSEFRSASPGLLSPAPEGHASSLKDHAPSVEQGELQASACRTRVYKYRRTKRKSESKSVPKSVPNRTPLSLQFQEDHTPFLPSPEDHAPIPLSPEGRTPRPPSPGDQSPILFSDEHTPNFPSPEGHTPSIETLLQMLQANTQTERVSKHRKSGRERSKSKSALDYIPTSLESQSRGVKDHTPSTKTLGHREQTSWEQMSNNSESVLDQDLVPDIGREVVATDSYLAEPMQYTEPQYSDTAGYTVVGGEGVEWDAAELSNPDYTGMALLERRSHHPDFTCGNKQAGMFAVVLGSNGAELEL